MAKNRILVVPWTLKELDAWTSRVYDNIGAAIIAEDRTRVNSLLPYQESAKDPLTSTSTVRSAGRVENFKRAAAYKPERSYTSYVYGQSNDALKGLSDAVDVYVLGHGHLHSSKMTPFSVSDPNEPEALTGEDVVIRLGKMGLRESRTWKGKLKIYACYSALSGLAQEIKRSIVEHQYNCSVYGYQLRVPNPRPDVPRKGAKVLNLFLADDTPFQFVTAKFVRREMTKPSG